MPPPADSEPPPSAGPVYNGYVWPPQPAYESPLTLAAKGKDPEIANLLMHRGALATPSTPVTAGTPLLYAVWEELADLVQELLRRAADPNQRGTVLERDNPSFPLLLAAEKGNIEIISCLVGAGARVNDQD